MKGGISNFYFFKNCIFFLKIRVGHGQRKFRNLISELRTVIVAIIVVVVKEDWA